MAITTTETAGAREWTARPNRSLPPTECRVFCGLIVVVSLGVGIAFAFFGAPLVLPFAGLELGLLYFALRHLARADNAFESIRLDGNRLTVTHHFPSGNACQHFHAGWARISLEAAPPDEPMVCIRAHGHHATLGRLMTPAQRRQLVQDLHHSLQP